MTEIRLPSPVEIAALLCSRVCHDVIGPIGAIGNGIEVMEEDDSEEMRVVAIDLIRSSARSAAGRLGFARLAFGYGGGAGAEIDLVEAEKLAREYIETERTRLEWTLPAGMMPKDRVKLFLIFVALAGQALPRGGVISVAGDPGRIVVEARGTLVRVNPALPELLAAAPTEPVDARTVVGLYAGLVAGQAGLAAAVAVAEGRATFTAV